MSTNHPAAPAYGESMYGPSPGSFTPQATSDVRRTTRRMPEVEDFPAVGQREYRAKSARSDLPDLMPTPHQGKPPQEPKKSTLFQKLAGVGRPRAEAPLMSPDAESREPLPGFLNPRQRSG
jgi:cell division protein FtsZ